MRDYFEGYDAAPIDAGFKNEPLAADDYPMTCERIIRAQFSKGGSLGVTFLFRVNEGPYEKRTALVQQYLTPAVLEVRTDDNGELMRDASGQLQRVRVDDDVYKAKSVKAQGRTRGIVHAFTGDAEPRDTYLDPPSGDMPVEGDEAYYLERIGINECVGQGAIISITRQGDGNGATRFKHIEDPKDGLAAWRNKTLPKQIARRQRENPTAQVSAPAL